MSVRSYMARISSHTFSLKRSMTWCVRRSFLGVRPPFPCTLLICLTDLSSLRRQVRFPEWFSLLSGRGFPTLEGKPTIVGQGLFRVTEKVLSYSKHTLLLFRRTPKSTFSGWTPYFMCICYLWARFLPHGSKKYVPFGCFRGDFSTILLPFAATFSGNSAGTEI